MRVAVAIAALLFACSGCGKPQAATAKEDEQGKQANDIAAKRMIQEQTGKTPPAGANGQ